MIKLSPGQKINFRDSKFEKYHVFKNVRNTVSDNLVPPGDLLLRSRLVRLLLRSHLPVKKPGYGPEAYNTGLTRNDLPPRHHEWKTFSRCHFKQKWRDLESLLRQTVKRSRFRLRNSQNGNLADKSSSEQFVWTKLAWIDWLLYLQQVHEKIWSRVTNSRMPFAVNVTPSLSYTTSLVYLWRRSHEKCAHRDVKFCIALKVPLSILSRRQWLKLLEGEKNKKQYSHLYLAFKCVSSLYHTHG